MHEARSAKQMPTRNVHTAGNQDSQCLDASWRTGGAAAVAAQIPRCLEPNRVPQRAWNGSARGTRERRETPGNLSMGASRRCAEERIASREILGILIQR